MIITIDGPAGSGKSTAARELAVRLGIAYLDTGAMYRAIALQVLQQGLRLDDASGLARLARATEMSVRCSPGQTRVILDGRDVTDAVRSMEVTRATPFVARLPSVRQHLASKQRQLGRQLGSLVADGRDQGSVVFPDAEVKFFLDAAIDKRAQRRWNEMVADGQNVTYEQVLENLRQRDGNDASQWAPLLVPGEAIRIDTTEMNIAEVVDRLEQIVRQRTARTNQQGR